MNIKKRIHKFTKVVFEVANCVGNPVYKVVFYFGWGTLLFYVLIINLLYGKFYRLIYEMSF